MSFCSNCLSMMAQRVAGRSHCDRCSIGPNPDMCVSGRSLDRSRPVWEIWPAVEVAYFFTFAAVKNGVIRSDWTHEFLQKPLPTGAIYIRSPRQIRVSTQFSSIEGARRELPYGMFCRFYEGVLVNRLAARRFHAEQHRIGLHVVDSKQQERWELVTIHRKPFGVHREDWGLGQRCAPPRSRPTLP